MKSNFKLSKIKTTTLSHPGGDDPSISLLLGHVGSRAFTRAFKKEGWVGVGKFKNSDLRHEYWVILKRSARKSTITDKKAMAVTVNDW